MDAVDVALTVTVVIVILIVVGLYNYDLWKSRRDEFDEIQAHNSSLTAEEKIKKEEFYRWLHGDAKANKMFPEEGNTKGQATQQHAGEHGVQMQFISSEMPKNVTPQYVTVVTQPHY